LPEKWFGNLKVCFTTKTIKGKSFIALTLGGGVLCVQLIVVIVLNYCVCDEVCLEYIHVNQKH
jgi:hypothetical protein